MKKVISFILVALIATPAFSQFDNHRKGSHYNHQDTEQYFGARLGLNIASLSSETSELDMDSRTGIAFGGVYGRQLSNTAPIWLEGGLYISFKGGKTSWPSRVENDPNFYKVTTRLTYLQVPIVCKYSFNVADEFYVQPFLGGFFALGIGGKTKDYGLNRDDAMNRFSHSSYDYFNRFDGGLRLGCGAEYKMLYAEMGFDFGLADVGKDDIETTHTRNFFINVGVNF